jgi:hypothetical protein
MVGLVWFCITHAVSSQFRFLTSFDIAGLLPVLLVTNVQMFKLRDQIRIHAELYPNVFFFTQDDNHDVRSAEHMHIHLSRNFRGRVRGRFGTKTNRIVSF